MRILVLGGTIFLGRAIVIEALDRGHEVATFNRGLSGPSQAGVETFIGDRASVTGLDVLAGQRFDAVIDTSRQAVSHVRRAVAALSPVTGRYAFISTCSVYAELSPDGTDENGVTFSALSEPSLEQEADRQNYPALNAACEQAVADALPDRHLLLRPGLIVGDRDPSDRFGYWPMRIHRGGQVLVPAPAGQLVQFVDVRDLAAFALSAVEQDLSGPYNVTGPSEPTTLGGLLDACEPIVGVADYTWVDERFLLGHDVQPYLDLPLWIPQEGDEIGFNRFRSARAVAAGLTHRPVTDTVAAAFDWETELGLDRERAAGLAPAAEQRLLREWAGRARIGS